MNPIDAPNEDSAAPPASRVENLLSGLAIIIVGLVLLARNFGLRLPFVAPDNWWALFILIAAVPPTCKALYRYRSIGGFDAQVARRVLSAVSTVSVGLIFLLQLSFAVWWPVFVIIGGLYMLFPDRKQPISLHCSVKDT
ncbi:MAG: hypothetical protein ABI365_05020 [Lysobacteraceae bacterium]